jgi:hypothetical protein
MPQTTYLPVYTADYPILAKAQKPGGVTVLSGVTGGDVPNKHTFVAGTIQIAQYEAEATAVEQASEQASGGGSSGETTISSDEEIVESSPTKRKRK